MANHAAYAPEDVEDARRGHPTSDLTEYARSRGLEPVGQALVGHFSGLNPLWPDYTFNVARGAFPGDRYGAVQHELREVGLGDDGSPGGSGEWFGRRTTVNPGLRNLIGLHKEPKNEPFAAQAMWVPVTATKVLVPEAALLPRIVILGKTHSSFLDPSLDPWAPSFRMVKSQWVSDEWQAAIAAAVGPTLQSLGDRFVRLELKHGALGLQVNGFRADPADLDRLVAATSAMGDALAEVARPWWTPGPFDAPLGAFSPSTHPPGYVTFDGEFDSSGIEALDRDAAAFGMTVEDPAALHRRFPKLALPGTSRGLLAGSFPGTSTFGRLSFQTQGHPGSSAYLRRGAVIEAAAEAAPTPIGGVLLAETDMYVAVGGGLACCWTRTNSEGRLDTAELLEKATATFRARGLV